MASLQGKVMAITGAASGIGLATAKVLAERGAVLSLADVDGPALNAAAESFAEQRHLTTVLDVRDSAQVDSWVHKSVQSFGALDAAVNAAGVIGRPTPIMEEADERYEFIMGVNCRGIFNCVRAQLRHMNEGGSIVNVTSAAGLMGSPGSSIYCASKHAVIGLTRAVAREVGSKNIRVNCVAPGVISTPMVKEIERNIHQKLPTTQQALDRQADADEVARVITFLASTESSFVTGSTYCVDGGWTA